MQTARVMTKANQINFSFEVITICAKLYIGRISAEAQCARHRPKSRNDAYSLCFIALTTFPVTSDSHK